MNARKPLKQPYILCIVLQQWSDLPSQIINSTSFIKNPYQLFQLSLTHQKSNIQTTLHIWNIEICHNNMGIAKQTCNLWHQSSHTAASGGGRIK